MKKILFLFLMIPLFSFSQIGIGTNTPQGQLDVFSSTLGLVLPRVTSVEDVTSDGSSLALNGTIVYDVSRKKICFKINTKWVCKGINATGGLSTEVINDSFNVNPTPVIIKQPSNTEESNRIIEKK